ncbi:MAG: lipase family protein [Planctomycetota bacterium]|nr:lipase family protein [Planctomycetota bacterium]
MNSALQCLIRPGLDLEAAVLLARASEVAYEPNAAIISAWAVKQGFSSATPFNQGNIQGFHARSPDVALLVFRGTSNLGQWVRDARLIPADHPWGRVHIGFRNGLQNVEDHLQQFEAAAAQAQHVWVTGHSLGGALAVLAAARLQRNGIGARSYTYGQPRVGLSGFAERFDAELTGRLVRFINQSDIVPRLPPGLLYRHCGLVKRIVSPGNLESLDRGPLELSNDDLPALSDEQFELLLQEIESHPESNSDEALTLEGPIGWFKDHSMLDYIRLLTEIRDNRREHDGPAT